MNETITFMYKYYKLQPKIDYVKDLLKTRMEEFVAEIDAEVQKLKERVQEIPELFKKLVGQYLEKAKEAAKKIQGKSDEMIAEIEQMSSKISEELSVYVTKV